MTFHFIENRWGVCILITELTRLGIFHHMWFLCFTFQEYTPINEETREISEGVIDENERQNGKDLGRYK